MTTSPCQFKPKHVLSKKQDLLKPLRLQPAPLLISYQPCAAKEPLDVGPGGGWSEVLPGHPQEGLLHLGVDLLALPLGLLVLVEAVLVQAPEVGYHATVVQLGGPLLPPGNGFSTLVAPSNVRLCRLSRERIPERTGFGGHPALSHSGLLWIKTHATS